MIANNQFKGGKWKRNSPTFEKIVKKIEGFFCMKVNATRFNQGFDGLETLPP